MEKPTDFRVERRWYFTFWSTPANAAFAMAATICTASGDPTHQDIREIEKVLREEVSRDHGKYITHGMICTGWYPLDFGEATDGD